ncbi:MAG: hypothetical protein V8Q42_12615 [Anaerovoracaceae bacterium]
MEAIIQSMTKEERENPGRYSTPAEAEAYSGPVQASR